MKKSRSSETDTIAQHNWEDRERFCIKSRGVEAQKRAVRYGKQRQEVSQNHMEMLIQSSQQQIKCNVVVSWKTYWKTLI